MQFLVGMSIIKAFQSHKISAILPIMSNLTKILVVDDSMVNLAVLDETLESLGFDVYLANNGERCLLTAKQIQPDLILLDVIMPGWDGYETCKRLKADKEVSHIPVLFLSGLEDTQNKVRALEAGGVDYVSKPFQESELLARVNTHLELSRLRHALQEEVDKKTAEIHNLLSELQISYQKAQEVSVLKTQFLHNISHEFRTPMNIILGSTDELIEDTELDEEQQEMTRDILQAGNRLMEVLTNMLNFSQKFNDEFNQKFEYFNIYEVINELIAEYQEIVEKKYLSFEQAMQADLPEQLYGNKTYIHDILDKLLNNAIKYTNMGSVYLRLEWLAEINQDTQETQYLLIFSIEDTGIGIADIEQQHLFQAFSQVDGSTTRQHDGMGMGLALVSLYIERLGGSIEVESEVGKGSCFCFQVTLTTEPSRTEDIAQQ